MFDGKSLKFMSCVSLIVGIGGSLLSKYVEEKERDAKIEEEVEKKIAEHYENEKES